MGKIINTSATMMCPHGGTIMGTASGKVTAGGAQVLTDTDTFTIAGCPLNISGAPHPCTSVRWIAPAMKVKAGGQVITTDSQGLCMAADMVPQGPPTLSASQTQADAL